MNSLSEALAGASPRLTPRPVSWVSESVYVVVGLAWIVLFAQAFLATGLYAWSIGIAYVGYDTLLLLFVAWRTWPLRRSPPPRPLPRAGSPVPSVGILIAARNEAATLERTIAALMAQTRPPETIIIADDGSTDETDRVLPSLYGFAVPALGEIARIEWSGIDLRWLRLRHGGKARALNVAIGQIDTDIVLTVDADTLLRSGALDAVRDAFAAEPLLVATTGVLIPACGPLPWQRLFQWFQTYEYARNFISRYAWMTVGGLLLISGAFAGFRRSALVEVGGFDPEFLVEDYELIHRLHRFSVDHRRGWVVRVLGEAMARTDAPDRVLPFLRQRRRWFAGFLQTQYWNRDMTLNPRYAGLGMLMLPVKAFDTLQPIYGLTAFVLLLWFLVTGRLGTVFGAVGVMGIKIVIDFAFYIWSIGLYRNWTGGRSTVNLGHAVVAALLEPFSFQLLRHAGAAWGWIAFLRGNQSWLASRRSGILTEPR